MRVFLVGAGHAHLHVLRHAPTLAAAGMDVALVAPATFRYSGVATAASSGEVCPDEGVVDVRALAREHGVTHVVGRLRDLDPDRRVARTEDDRALEFDLLSLNVGSVPVEAGMEVGPGVVRIKPLDAYLGLRARLDDLAGAGAARVVVVGSGASGLEVAGHVAARLPRGSQVVVVERDWGPAGFLAPGPRHAALSVLVDRGVTFRVGVPAVEVTGNWVVTADGRVESCDLAVLATGLRAHPVVEHVGLGDRQGVPVRATLEHVQHRGVFAAGDCAHFTPSPLPKLGVHGVRQGPVLLQALAAQARGHALPSYTPPTHVLQILDLGGGVGLATRGRWWSCGRGAHLLKHMIDQRWLRRVQVAS